MQMIQPVLVLWLQIENDHFQIIVRVFFGWILSYKDMILYIIWHFEEAWFLEPL